MSVYIEDTIINFIDRKEEITNVDDVVDGIIEDILDTIPAYIRSYEDNNIGFYPYLKNIVTYLLNGLRALFDLQLMIFDTQLLREHIPSPWTPSKRQVICAKKVCDIIGIVDTDVSGFIIEGNEDETLQLQFEYLKARYTSEVLKRTFTGTYNDYLTLLKTALPQAESIEIVDQGVTKIDESSNANMIIGSNVTDIRSNYFQLIDKDTLKTMIVPNILGVSRSTSIADRNTLFWDYKNEAGLKDDSYARWINNIEGVDGGSDKPDRNGTPRVWTGEY